jgi:hypothetical protein
MKYSMYIVMFLIFIGIICVSIHSSKHSNKEISYKSYTLDMYTDTINELVILTTVINNGVSVNANSIVINDIYGQTN